MPALERVTYLQEALQAAGIEVSTRTVQALAAYAEAVLAANPGRNLTAAGSWQELVDRHLVDCLVGIRLVRWQEGQQALDLGSGAGLPGMPLALVQPQVAVVLVEARTKKADFLWSCAQRLGMKNVQVVAGRAEDLGWDPEWREKADRVLARGVAPLAVLVEYALPLLRVGGWLLAWKGPALKEELGAATPALSELGGKVGAVYDYRLGGGRERRLVVVSKIVPTPAKYPRRPGMARKRPLGVDFAPQRRK